jgi:cyclohexadienyl dehydratase
MTTWRLGTLAVFVLLWSLSPARANGPDDIRARGLLRIGTSGDYQPFSLCAEPNKDCQGFDVDVARHLAADLGVRLEIVRFRWPELRDDLAAGKFDIAMSGVTIRPERALTGTFTRPYVVTKAVVIVADKEKFSSVGKINQAGVHLAVNAGGHLEQVAHTQFPQATILSTPRNLSLADQVEKQEADALLTDSLEAPHFLATYPRLYALPAFGRDHKAYLVRRADSPLREWLDTWLVAHEKSVLTPLREHWFTVEAGSVPPAVTNLLVLMDLRLALMPAVAQYKSQYNLPIEDPAQEATILEHAEAQAQGAELDRTAIRELFRLQIELAKQVQRATLQGLIPVPAWARGLDLNTDLRPVLVELGNRIVQELGSGAANLPDLQFTLRSVEEEITTAGISAEAKRQLGEALWRTRKQTGSF